MTSRPLHRVALCVAVIATSLMARSAGAGAAPAASPDRTWVANGIVWAVQPAGAVTYLGGDFTEIAPATGNVIEVDPVTGDLDPSFPTVSGLVRAVVPRPGGGWLLGGSFTMIGGHARAGLAATGPTGGIGGWNPKAKGGGVTSMALSPDGTVLYVAGTFTSIGAAARDGLAAFTTADLKLTSWAPSPVTGGIVAALAVGPAGTVYVGGSFTGIAGNGRSRIAAIAPNGTVTSWNPGATDQVDTLVATESTIYAGGAFTTLAHASQLHVGAIDAASASAAGWTGGGADGEVRALALSGTTLYVGGAYSTLDGIARASIGALDAATGTATSFAPGADGAVNVLNASNDGGTLVAAGPFATIGGADARRLASIDTTSGVADPGWAPAPNDLPRAIGRSPDGSLLVGGSFTGAGGVLRDHLAAIDATTGQATAWDPGADATVYALALDPDGGTVYAGGAFTRIGEAPRQKLAAIDAATGDVETAFHVGANNRVRSLAAAGDRLYVGGQFTKLGGQGRASAGAVQLSTASLDPTWRPAADGMVRTIVPDGGRVYLGGDFAHVGGGNLDHVAAVDATTGSLVASFAAAGTKYRTFQLATDGTLVFAAMGGPGGRLRAYRASDGSIAWEDTADGDVQACAVSGGLVIIGGHFDTLDHVGRHRIGAADAASGSLDGWAPSLNGSIWTLESDGAAVHLGGSFTRVQGVVRDGYARFAAT